MHKQNLPVTPDENQIEELLAKIQPKPSPVFFKKIEQASWQVSLGQPIKSSNFRPRWVIAMTVVVLIVGILIVTPQGRAWAQELLGFFRRINSASVQISDEQIKQMDEIHEPYDLPLVPVFVPTVSPEMATISGCETPQKAQSYRCQILLAESTLGFDLKELPEKPNNWEFKTFYFNADYQVAVMNYELDFQYNTYTTYSSLSFTQGASDFSNLYENSPWYAVPADKVEPVTIGDYNGEYVKGGFGLPAGSNELVWNADRQRLAWSEGAHWYFLDFHPNLNVAGTMGKDQLIELAESLITSPVQTTEPLNPDHLSSIFEAERLSRLNLKAPTLLPMDIDFSYARYFPNGQQVHLIYGFNEELTISEWAGEPINYTKPSNVYEVVYVNGEVAYYDHNEGPESHLFLWWHKDGLNYHMDYDQSFGWQINKEKMISIAESMQDIGDFKKGNRRNYEQIVIYEQALGIDIKRFPEAPSGWVFANFWSDAYAQCINLIYSVITGKDTFSINQCKTNKRFDISNFPSNSSEQVKVGNIKGWYIMGDFVINNDGKQVWELTAPQKQLYWQEDELWLQIILYGDGALLYDKEDLIYIAESLR